MPRMKRLALAALLIVGALAGVSLAAGEWLTRPARQAIGAPPPELAGAEAVQFRSADGLTVSGWFVPGRVGQGAVLLQHSVRSNRLQMLARARWLQREGLASLLIDLPSHGESAGDRLTFGHREARATEAALAWLRTRVPGERIGAIGVSLGGAALLFAQRQPELDALVLESVYPSITLAVHHRLAMRLGEPAAQLLAPLLLVQLPLRLALSPAQLRPIDALAAVRAPLLIAAGTRDEHTRWSETESLYAAATASTDRTLWPVPGAAHVDLHAFHAGAYEDFVGGWLRRQLRKAPA